MAKHCFSRLALVAGAALLALTGCAAPTSSLSPAGPQADAAIDDYLKAESEQGFSGTVLVLRHDAVLLHKSYGKIGAASPTVDTRYWLASVTKQFTAAAILKLRDQGALKLTDTIDRFLPDVPADKRGISIEELLTHRTGLPQDYVTDGVADRATAVKAILAQAPAGPRGQKFLYSNDNYQLAAAIIEIISGRSYEEFVTAELLLPAGMRNTGFWGGRESETVAPTTQPGPQRRHWGQIGSGGMYSTTRDLALWLRAIRGGKVLSPAAARDLFSQHVPLKQGSYGFGWFRSDDGLGGPRVFTRGNEDFGPNAYIDYHFGPGITFILLSHTYQAPDGTIWTRRLRDGIHQRIAR